MPVVADPSIIRPVALFKGLSDDALAEVFQAGRIRRLAAGERIFSQGMPAETCHTLVHGEVKIVQTAPDGQQVIVHFLGPQEMYGTVAVLMGGRFPADAVAVVDSIEMVWSRQAMESLMERHAGLARNALRIVGKRFLQAQQRVREMATEKVERRIAHALLRLARESGRPVAAGVEIGFPLSRQDLAEMTGTTLHTVSRTLSGWEAAGMVESRRRNIVVTDLDRLAQVADELPEAGRAVSGKG